MESIESERDTELDREGMKLLAGALGLDSVKELAALMADQALEDLTHVRSTID